MPIALNKSPWLAVSVLALAVAACDDRRDARIAAPEPAPLAALDSESALPYAAPARVDYLPADRGYQYAERAYGLQRTFYDVEPDYGFDYGGYEPLVWETADDWSLYAEPYDDGYRYYYYEPGADYPYFVRDDDYGYAYGTGGILLAMFDSGGRYLSRDYVYRAAPLAGRYWARGRDLHDVGHRARRIEVTDQYWTRAAPRISRSAEPWIRAADAEPRWREWRVKDRDRELNRFRPEQDRRANGRREARFERREDQGFTPIAPSDTARFERRGDERRAERFQEARGRAQAEQRARAQEQVRARDEARGHQQAEARGREQARTDQQARAEQQARGREQADNRARQQAQAEQRGRQQAEAHARQQQQQQARAEEQARGRQQAQARQQADAHARQAQQQQQRAQADRRGQMEAQRAQQAQQHQARAAEQHARQAAARERAPQPQARPQQRPQQGGGRVHEQGNGKDRKER